MSRSAVNYKYINKYGASNEATSSSSYYVTCVRVNVCACALCVVWVALRGISTTRAIA